MQQPSEKRNSYSLILKSTAIIGGTSVVVILLKVVQTKAMALLIGPVGVGLIGIFGSIIDLIGMVAGMGIGTSGVRQIAESSGTEDQIRIATTVITLRRATFFLGFMGMLLLFLFRNTVCQITFGNTDHADALAILSPIILMVAVSNGQDALLQGLRRIGDLARVNVCRALFAMIFSIPLVFFLGERGIVLFLVMVSALGILTSWWYARKVDYIKLRLSLREMATEAQALFRLGLVFMVTGLMVMATGYCVRVLVIRDLGVDAVGLLQASSNITGLYVGFILSAMGADFYPRLTGVASDNSLCNRIVNEQTEVGILLAVPGILATLLFAPYVLQIFYSAQFYPAIDILRWSLIGIFMRVALWPLGFILLAKGKGKIFFWTELLSNLVHISLVVILLRMFGLPGVGMAFLGLYVFYWVLITNVVHRVSGFTLSMNNRRHYLRIFPTMGAVFLSVGLLPERWGFVIGTLLTFAMGIYCLNALRRVIGKEKIAEFIGRVRSKISFV